MNEQQKKQIGKFISLVLRHAPEKAGIRLDNTGWASVDQLLKGLKRHGKSISFSQLEDLVITNDKQRYSFNQDKTKIRANQGHSLKLDLNLTPTTPPEVLYHGTATRFLSSIQQQGLQKRGRHHVHLSADSHTALTVGKRHGKPVILTIDAKAMHDGGHVFYCSDNGVWLTDHVPTQYFSSSGKDTQY